ncbi:MAG TPA: hypothetical protein VIF13_05870 [Hyphomicrobium sp.]
MRISSPTRFMMTAQTDKEARLKDFIAEGLSGLAAGVVGTVTLIVRDSESPVARALGVALSEGLLEASSIKVILASAQIEDGAPSLRDVAGVECRLLKDPRFGASHEQLVIGRTHVWIGDCLRRDPNKRDAFELYHKADAAARMYAAVSFEKLWAHAKPMKPVTTGSVSLEAIAAAQADDAEALPRPRCN